LLRKGRSQYIGVVISVQSASNIPAPIANNLHSVIAFRHNSEEAAGHIKKLFDKDARNLQSGAIPNFRSIHEMRGVPELQA